MKKRRIVSIMLIFSMVMSIITILPVFSTEAKASTYEDPREKKIINIDKLKPSLSANDTLFMPTQDSYEEIKYELFCNDRDIEEVKQVDALQIQNWLESEYTFSSAFIGYDYEYEKFYGLYSLNGEGLKRMEYTEEIPINETKIREDNNYTLEYKGDKDGKWFKIVENRFKGLCLQWENNELKYNENCPNPSWTNKNCIDAYIDIASITDCNSTDKSYTVEGIYDRDRTYYDEHYIYASTDSNGNIQEIFGCYSFTIDIELDFVCEKNQVFAYQNGRARLGVEPFIVKSSNINYQWYKIQLTDEEKENYEPDDDFPQDWYKWKGILTPERLASGKLENETSPYLQFIDVKESDFGEYVCEITDDLDNRVALIMSLNECKIENVEYRKELKNLLQCNHNLDTIVTGALDDDRQLNRDEIEVSSSYSKILPQDGYKYIWLRYVYNDGWNVPTISNKCIDNYIDSNHERITLKRDSINYVCGDAGSTDLYCFVIPKEKYDNNIELKEAVNKVKNSTNKSNAVKELREKELQMAVEYINNGNSNQTEIEEYFEYPLGLKYTEYKERISFYSHRRDYSTYKNYVVKANLGEKLVLHSWDITTNYPLEYRWYHHYTKSSYERDLVYDSVEMQDYKEADAYTYLKCPHNEKCEEGKCIVEDSRNVHYNVINISDLSVTGDVVGLDENNMKLNVYAQGTSSPLRFYNWYKRTVGGEETKLSDTTSSISVSNTDKYTGKEITGSISYVCKVNDGFEQKEVIFNIRDNQKFEVIVDNQKINTNAEFIYSGEKNDKITLDPSVSNIDNDCDITYEWILNGKKISTDSSLQATYPNEGANVYEVNIKNSSDTDDVDTVTIKYILRPIWENNMIEITEDLTDNSSSNNSGNGSSNSGSSGSSSGGSSSGGSSGSSSGGSSSGDTSSEDKKTEDSKDETTKDDENKEETNNGETTPSKDVVQSQPSQTAEKQVVKETEQIIKDIEENKVSDKVISEETANNVKEAIKEGKEIVTDIVSQSIKKEEITQPIVTKINDVVKKLSTKAKIAEYLNLEVQLKTEDKVLGNINELSKPIDFTVKIPDNMKAANRKYFVLRVHNGVVEKLDTVVNKDGTLTFKTDKFSTYALAYEDVIKPGLVKNLKVSPATKSVKLTWAKDKNATGYRISMLKNGKWVKLKDTTLTNFSLNNIASGTSLKFAVKSYYKSAISLEWADKATTINTCTKPSKVTGLASKVVTKNAVKTSWKKTNGATGYKVYVAKNGKWVSVGTTKNNTYTFKGLKKNTKYKFAVKAYKKVGNKTVYADSFAVVNVKTKR